MLCTFPTSSTAIPSRTAANVRSRRLSTARFTAGRQSASGSNPILQLPEHATQIDELRQIVLDGLSRSAQFFRRATATHPAAAVQLLPRPEQPLLANID